MRISDGSSDVCSSDQLDIHLVLHGDAARYLLINTTYRDAVDDPFAVNLNAKIVQDLLKLGVSVEICHSTMKSNGWTADDVDRTGVVSGKSVSVSVDRGGRRSIKNKTQQQQDI